MPGHRLTSGGEQERVLDLLDIDYLRLAAKDTDSAYKTLVWNLSQNVDRTTGSVKPGICPCLTPNMVPFVTNRGGPLIGLEALSLQVLPLAFLRPRKQAEGAWVLSVALRAGDPRGRPHADPADRRRAGGPGR